MFPSCCKPEWGAKSFCWLVKDGDRIVQRCESRAKAEYMAATRGTNLKVVHDD
jgi:hypothetical protein